jgi:nitrate reductase beta subunit
MYRLLAIAKYEDRYVIPTAFNPQARDLEQMGCSLDEDGGPGMYEAEPAPVSVETFHAQQRSRVNLLNWDGGKVPAGMFPEEHRP